MPTVNVAEMSDVVLQEQTVLPSRVETSSNQEIATILVEIQQDLELIAEELPSKKELSEKRPGFSVRSYAGREIIEQPELLSEMARLYCEVFNANFPEFLCCQNCDKTFSAEEIFGTHSEAMTAQFMVLPDDSMPNCPCCNQKMELFNHPIATQNALAKKFAKDGIITSLMDNEHQLQGFTFGFRGTVSEIFASEWKNRYGYTRNPHPERSNDFDTYLNLLRNNFYAVMGTETHFGPDTQAFCWNSAVMSPRFRGKGILAALTQNFLSSVPVALLEGVAVLGETIKDSVAYGILTKKGFTQFSGLLPEPYVHLVGNLGFVAKCFASPKDDFKQGR